MPTLTILANDGPALKVCDISKVALVESIGVAHVPLYCPADNLVQVNEFAGDKSLYFTSSVGTPVPTWLNIPTYDS